MRKVICVAALFALAVSGMAAAQTCTPEVPPGDMVPAYAPCPENLIVNGDFEETDGTQLSFTSDYRPYLTLAPADPAFAVPGECLQATGCGNDNMWCEGVWVIGQNPANFHQLWYNTKLSASDPYGVGDFGDHTTNRGNMLILNGAAQAGTVVWRQTVSGIAPNTMYSFSFWARSAYTVAAPILTVTANSEELSLVPFEPVPGEWQQVSYEWLSGSDTDVTFEITNTENALSGNDYALDDIELCYACPVQSEPLCAGQTMDIGTVEVTNDGDNLYVTFTIDEENWEGWYLDETHVAVATDPTDLPQTKKGNPIPGQFPYSCDSLEAAQTSCTATIPLGDWCEGQLLFIAAHAAVVEVDGDGCCDMTYWANVVDGYDQGTRKDGSPVLGTRDDPAAVFAIDGSDSSGNAIEGNFYSLGFDLVDDVYIDGWLRLGFGAPVYNGPGDDVVIQEITNNRSGYPLEQAGVFGVDDGLAYFAGAVDNENVSGGDGFVTIGLPSGRTHYEFIELVDATDPGPHNAEADGYDVDAVGACYLVVGDETAWGDGCEGTRFTARGNWGTYFEYTVSACASCATEVCADFRKFEPGASIEDSDAVLPGLTIVAAGTAVALFEGQDPVVFGAPNNGTCNVPPNDFPPNGCLDPNGGFSDDETENANSPHFFTFTFDTPVDEFSVHMVDYGDFNPTNAADHFAVMTAYDADDNEVDSQVLDYTSAAEVNPRTGDWGDMACPVTNPGGAGDACSAPEGSPGNFLWTVQGSGITKVTLEFGTGYDPKIGFDNLCVVR